MTTWTYKLDFTFMLDDTAPAECIEKAQAAIRAMIEAHPWLEDDRDLEFALEQFECTDDREGYDEAMVALYDWADNTRCWIKTRI